MAIVPIGGGWEPDPKLVDHICEQVEESLRYQLEKGPPTPAHGVAGDPANDPANCFVFRFRCVPGSKTWPRRLADFMPQVKAEVYERLTRKVEEQNVRH